MSDSTSLQHRLRDKRVVILGGSSGIGFAVAQAVQAAGAQVEIASSNGKRLAAALERLGGDARGEVLDLFDDHAIKQYFDALGAFDHLVYTAGDRLHLQALEQTDLQQARNAFELRYWSVLSAVKQATPHLRAGGSIVLTTGIAGLRPQKHWVLAASVCGALESLTRALAVELAPIRVNAVSPGLIRTDLWQAMSEGDRTQMYANVGAALPVGQVGEAEDVAAAYLFLLQGGFSTGQTYVVDGGSVLV